jgi:hypothetical protein
MEVQTDTVVPFRARKQKYYKDNPERAAARNKVHNPISKIAYALARANGIKNFYAEPKVVRLAYRNLAKETLTARTLGVPYQARPPQVTLEQHIEEENRIPLEDTLSRSAQTKSATNVLTNEVASCLASQGHEPLSPGPGDPDFGLAYIDETDGAVCVFVVKSAVDANLHAQFREGLLQAQRVRWALRMKTHSPIRVFLVTEQVPTDPDLIGACIEANVSIITLEDLS